MYKRIFNIFLIIIGMIAIFKVIAGDTSNSSQQPAATSESASSAVHPLTDNTVTITPKQAQSVNVEIADLYNFEAQRKAVGYIDFNQDRVAQIFSPWQGRITEVKAKAGDDVKKGDLLFTLDSPDLLQAESTLISTASLLQLADKGLERARKLIETQSNTQRDLEQAISDQQTAEANYKAGRDAVRIFGKSDVEIEKLLSDRKVSGTLHIYSPFTGRITARDAAIGMLVQPGSSPAPFTVANLSDMWMVANVNEYELPKLKLGQQVSVAVMAYPNQKFQGVISNIATSVDPATHSIAIRSEINDPNHMLRPQMLATFVIHDGESSRTVGIPPNGVVNEGEGVMAVFVTTDGNHFERRKVKLGISQNGLQQILEGVSEGEKVATDGALFLSNALALQSK